MKNLFTKHFFKFLTGFLLVLLVSFFIIAFANSTKLPNGTSQFANPKVITE